MCHISTNLSRIKLPVYFSKATAYAFDKCLHGVHVRTNPQNRSGNFIILTSTAVIPLVIGGDSYWYFKMSFVLSHNAVSVFAAHSIYIFLKFVTNVFQR